MSTEKKPKLLIFVIAYYAESTLRKVLERIPGVVFTDFDCQILVIDDASDDRTFAIGHEYKKHHPEIPMTVLRNEYNQGYGGNQKIGYQFAIDNSFDFVAMVHGDGQYAPEELPRLVAPLAAGTADAVFGSRMMDRFSALRGGMPLYKYAGNKILTRVQNAMLGTHLSEFHSGYRIYSVAALERIPFHLNSNDFHFDTEIIIQLVNAKLRIEELPIPTYYGDEICRVNGMKYAKDVMLATARNTLHRAGVLYQRRFDVEPENHHYDLKLGYASSHTFALEAVPNGSRVIDIGAGPGGVAKELRKKDCAVTVVDRYAPSVEMSASGGSEKSDVEVIMQNLDAPPTFSVADKDYILLLDVIEHLQSPEHFLAELRRQFTHERKKIILTTPNIAFFVQRLMLLAGQFNYGKAGILDQTHTRLFTFRSLRRLLDDAGFRITDTRGVPVPFPKIFGNGIIGRTAVRLNELLIDLSPTLFSYQIFIAAESTPNVEFLLRDAKVQSEARAKPTRALHLAGG